MPPAVDLDARPPHGNCQVASGREVEVASGTELELTPMDFELVCLSLLNGYLMREANKVSNLNPRP